MLSETRANTILKVTDVLEIGGKTAEVDMASWKFNHCAFEVFKSFSS